MLWSCGNAGLRCPEFTHALVMWKCRVEDVLSSPMLWSCGNAVLRCREFKVLLHLSLALGCIFDGEEIETSTYGSGIVHESV